MAVKHFFAVLPLCAELFVALGGAVGLEQSRECAKVYSCRILLEIPAHKPCLQSWNWRERERERGKEKGKEVKQVGHRGVIKDLQRRQREKTERENIVNRLVNGEQPLRARLKTRGLK